MTSTTAGREMYDDRHTKPDAATLDPRNREQRGRLMYLAGRGDKAAREALATHKTLTTEAAAAQQQQTSGQDFAAPSATDV